MPFNFDCNPEHWYQLDENGNKVSRLSETMKALIRRMRDDPEFRDRFLEYRQTVLNEFPELSEEERQALLIVPDERLRQVMDNVVVQKSTHAAPGSLYDNAVLWTIITMLGMATVIAVLTAQRTSVSSLFQFVSGGVTTKLFRPRKDCPGNIDQLGRIAAAVMKAQKKAPSLKELQDLGLVAKDFACAHGGKYLILSDDSVTEDLRVVCTHCTG